MKEFCHFLESDLLKQVHFSTTTKNQPWRVSIFYRIFLMLTELYLNININIIVCCLLFVVIIIWKISTFCETVSIKNDFYIYSMLSSRIIKRSKYRKHSNYNIQKKIECKSIIFLLYWTVKRIVFLVPCNFISSTWYNKNKSRLPDYSIIIMNQSLIPTWCVSNRNLR